MMSDNTTLSIELLVEQRGRSWSVKLPMKQGAPGQWWWVSAPSKLPWGMVDIKLAENIIPAGDSDEC